MAATELDILRSYDGGNQDGGDLAYFTGKQYGSGWLRTLGRFAFPILKRVVHVAGNVAQDALNNPQKPILNSIRDNALSEVAQAVGQTVGTSINTTRKRKLSSSSSSPATAPYYNKQLRRR